MISKYHITAENERRSEDRSESSKAVRWQTTSGGQEDSVKGLPEASYAQNYA
jgi:hypothetical protein